MPRPELKVASQTIDIQQTAAGVQITTNKKGAAPSAVGAAKNVATIRNRSGPRRAVGVAANLAKRGYRPDLRQVGILVNHLVYLFVSSMDMILGFVLNVYYGLSAQPNLFDSQ